MNFPVRTLLFLGLTLGVLGKALDSKSLYREKKVLDFLRQVVQLKQRESKTGFGSIVDPEPIPTDVSDPEDRETIRECMQIMAAYGNSETSSKTAEANRALKSCWPYTRKELCDEMHTRDVDYDPSIKLSAKSLSAESVCGKNMFMHEAEKAADDDLISFIKRVFEPDVTETMESRIVGGVKSDAGKYPWMVTIGQASHGLSCGGAIINKDWVMSAAHCFEKRDYPCQYNVRVGSFNWGYDTEGHHEDIAAEKIFTHPDYDDETNDNDISLIKLSKSLNLDPNGYINAVCLPETDREYEVGKSCVAAGWGTLKEDGHVPMTLQEVDLALISRKDCSHEDMTHNQFCAGYLTGKKDTCQGDSGGPVMCQRSDGRWYQQGVTSYGNGCGKKMWPGVYTQVPHYIHWINSVVERH